MIRVFPRKTKWTPDDELSFIGDPPLFLPPQQPVRISVTFTWDVPEGIRLAKAWSHYYDDVRIGGPALEDPGEEFTPGRFIKKGVTITSRGCPRRCTWCFVPSREGGIRELDIMNGWIVQDNNLLACSRYHIEGVFDMLTRQKKGIAFAGGIDSRLLEKWHRSLFESITIKEIWVACDSEGALIWLENTLDIIGFLPQRKRRCYVMIGFGNQSITEAEMRLEKVYELGFLPFAQLYRGHGERFYNQDWKRLARKWSRPAAYRKIKQSFEGFY